MQKRRSTLRSAKKVLKMDLYVVTSLQMQLWPAEHFFPLKLDWGLGANLILMKKSSTGQSCISTEGSSYKIYK